MNLESIAKEYLLASLSGANSNELETIYKKTNETFPKFMEIVDSIDISKTHPLYNANLYETCRRAFYNISFSPERRAQQYLKSYNAELVEDLKALGDNCGNYQEKYISKFSDWMYSMSRCYSVMITGPANFNPSRHEKRNRSEKNKYQEFINWRERYFKAVNRERTKSPEEDLFEAEEKLLKYEERNEEVKKINKIIASVNRKKNPTIEDVDRLNSELREYGYLKEGEKLTPYEWRNKLTVPTIGTYGASIKKQKERIIELQKRIEVKTNFEDIKFDGGYITVEDDRVKIFHDEKPEYEVIQSLKKRGFRWSRHWGCWCRKHTQNAINDAKYLTSKERI